jgi:type I site-specific restriction-modification system R (restriction) subunit
VIEAEIGGKKVCKENMIFPRYHQLDAVRKIGVRAREEGAGNNYLVMHSAGSGESNSIAWLAHRALLTPLSGVELHRIRRHLEHPVPQIIRKSVRF